MMTRLFKRQAGRYATYHRDPRNRIMHMIGIPAIMLSLLVFGASWRVSEAPPAWILAALAGIGWLALDLGLGAAMLTALVPMVLAADWIADNAGRAASLSVAAVLFAGGWAFQLIGHFFEGRRPALVDNLFQAFIGPMFIMAEFLELIGLRRKSRREAPAA